MNWVRIIKANKLLLTFMFAMGISYYYMAKDSYQMDYRAYYIGAKSITNGLDPYKNNTAVSQEYSDSGDKLVYSRFLYPPTSFPFISWFAFMPYKYSKMVFFGLLLVVLMMMFLFFKTKYALNDTVIGIIMLSFPVASNFERGQMDILILALVLVAYYSKNNWWAGLTMGSAIAIKLFPIIVMPYFFFTKRYKMLLTTGIIVAIWFAVSSLVWGVESYASFTHNLFNRTSELVNVITPDYLLENNRIISPEGTFTFNHNFIHGAMNPFLFMGQYIYIFTGVLVILFSFLYARIERFKQVESCGFFALLILSLIAKNEHTWITSLLFYIPFLIYQHSRKPLNYGLLIVLLLPVFLPRSIYFEWGEINRHLNYIIAIILVFYYFWKDIKEVGLNNLFKSQNHLNG